MNQLSNFLLIKQDEKTFNSPPVCNIREHLLITINQSLFPNFHDEYEN